MSTNRIGNKVTVGALLAVTFLLGCFPMTDADVWWHVGTGQIILQSGHIPHVDFLTYTNNGRPWIDLYWLFQIGIALLYKLGGATALVLFKASIGTLVVALALSSRKVKGLTWLIVLVWVPALVSLSGRLCERPEWISLLFIAVFLLILSNAQSMPKRLWALPFIEMIWVNCHGFFIFGPFLLLAYWIEVIYQLLLLKVRPPLKRLLLITIATLGACFVSPYGWSVITLPIQQYSRINHNNIYRFTIGEFRTLGNIISLGGGTSPYFISIIVLFVFGLASFLPILLVDKQ